MNATRRDMLIASLGAGLGAAAAAVLPGCQTPQKRVAEHVEGRPAPDFGIKPSARIPRNPAPQYPPLSGTTSPAKKTDPDPPIAREVSATSIAGLSILPRSAWTRTLGPVRETHNPMNGIKHITVHHEGWTPVTFEDKSNTIDRLEKIRGAHSRSKRDGGRGWADIGYHFVIDRAGRIWEARSLKLQGAHVENCNENNLGIMCLGNFDDQSPSPAQLASLISALKVFKAHFGVPMSEIFTHQEWKRRCPTTSTECPGRNLQAQMARIRTRDVLG